MGQPPLLRMDLRKAVAKPGHDAAPLSGVQSAPGCDLRQASQASEAKPALPIDDAELHAGRGDGGVFQRHDPSFLANIGSSSQRRVVLFHAAFSSCIRVSLNPNS